MADEEKREGEEEELGSSGLGNLPPLSDFDSQDDMTSDGGLPPLGNFDSDKDEDEDSGGLPPISDIEVETPEPAGGNIRPAPVGFDSGFGAASMDTPAPSSSFMRSPGSFQDLGSDSDFSPETPELGPGPSSGIDTPTFDTAFGGGGFQSPTRTPAPTQAMETPLFGAPSGPGGFDPGAFGGDFGGTPAPDFGADTDMGGARAPQPMMVAPEPRGGGGVGALAVVVVALVALIAGIFGGPFVADQSFMNWMPNPAKQKLDDAQQQIGNLEARNRQLNADLQEARNLIPKPGEGGIEITPEALEQLQRDIVAAQSELAATNQSLQDAKTNLASVEQDLQQKSEEVFQAQEQFTALETATKITQARRDGLEAEAARLTDQVGQLEDAAVRSDASKQALMHNVERLLAQVREGMPLTPDKYNHAARVEAVEALRTQVAEAKWVTPALMNAYNETVQKEIAIANASEYFFAKVSVTDRFGTKVEKWAECLMNGNWSVYYRTLDGKNIGVYENLASAGELPLWGYNEGLPKEAQEAIEARVVNARVPDYQEKVEFLAAKQMAEQGETNFQRNFDSL